MSSCDGQIFDIHVSLNKLIVCVTSHSNLWYWRSLEIRFIVEGGNYFKIISDTEEKLFIVTAGNCETLWDVSLLFEEE